MRLIDADALYDIVMDSIKPMTKNEAIILQDFIALLEDAPTIDAEPVRHGHWEDVDGFDCCSICGKPTYDSHDEYIEFNGMKIIALVKPYYCGYCGAKMDEVEDEE